ncbi:MFS transporter [Methanobrevibacter sp.]
MKNVEHKEKIFTRDFILITGALLFSALVMYTLMSTITEYATSMGSTASLAGLVSGIYVFGGLCSRIYSGEALQRIGWRKITLIFMSIHVLACFLYFFVDNISLLIIVRFIHGIGFGATINGIATIATSIIPKSRFSEAFGYYMIGTTIAVGLGPFIGGFIYDYLGSHACFAIAGIYAFIPIILILLIDVNKYNELAKSKEPKRYKGIEKVLEIDAIGVSLFTALTALGFVSLLSFHRLYADQIHLETTFSWFFIIYSICLLFTRPMAGRIQDRGGDKIVCIVGIISQTIGLLLIALIPSPVIVILCAILVSLGFGTFSSACTTIITRKTPPYRRTYALSTFMMFCDVTIGLGPALLGCFVSKSTGYSHLYIIAAIITLLALPICLYSLKDYKLFFKSST